MNPLNLQSQNCRCILISEFGCSISDLLWFFTDRLVFLKVFKKATPFWNRDFDIGFTIPVFWKIFDISVSKKIISLSPKCYAAKPTYRILSGLAALREYIQAFHALSVHDIWLPIHFFLFPENSAHSPFPIYQLSNRPVTKYIFEG